MQANQWDNNIVKSVHSLQDLAKLPIGKPEVQPKLELGEVTVTTTNEKPTPKEYAVRGSAWGTQRAKVQAALAYMKKHPEVTATSIAARFDIKIQTLYSAKYKAKMKVHDKLQKARAAKKERREEWKQSHVSTSATPVTSVTKTDVVNHPAHYKTGGIETIDFIEAKQLSYNLGNVVKYVTRADHKGNKLQDLEKAAWYLNREIENLKK